MEWLNNGVGVILLVSVIIIVLLLALTIFLLIGLRNRIAVQRLSFLGLYAADLESHVCYADLTIGNRSLNDVGIAEIGLRNGKVSYNLTALYKRKANLTDDARIVIEQRGALRFRLDAEELARVLTEDKNGKKVLKRLRLYAVDLTGGHYYGSVRAVRRLLADILAGNIAPDGTPVSTDKAAVPVPPAPQPAPQPVAQPTAQPAPQPAAQPEKKEEK